MGADVSRVRFDPLRDFAGVVLQQGRLLLDGDFNEYVALLDRRLRAETVDLTSFGPDPDQAGSLIELTRAGAEPLTLPDGTTRAWLGDGDEIVISAVAAGGISLGEVVGRVV